LIANESSDARWSPVCSRRRVCIADFEIIQKAICCPWGARVMKLVHVAVGARKCRPAPGAHESFTSMSHIKTPWKTQSLALSLANQLRVLASRAHTSGSLDKIQETCAQGLQVHSNLVHACHFYQQDQPTNFYASPNAALCGLTLHSWRHTATASPRTLARQARARTAGALFKISKIVLHSLKHLPYPQERTNRDST
jgi:hypothetical protein